MFRMKYAYHHHLTADFTTDGHVSIGCVVIQPREGITRVYYHHTPRLQIASLLETLSNVEACSVIEFLHGLESSGSDYTVTQRHIPEERNRQLHRCRSLTTRNCLIIRGELKKNKVHVSVKP